MALFIQRMKESQAQHINRVYNHRAFILGLKQGQAEGKARASFTARGKTLGVGSTKDAFVSSEILASLDRLTMNANKVRAVENKRLEAVNLGISATMLGVSESNMFATASTVSPFLNMTSTLMAGVGDFAANKGYGLFPGVED